MRFIAFIKTTIHTKRFKENDEVVIKISVIARIYIMVAFYIKCDYELL